ncbi:hypothetical protein ACJQWK_08654 [Exserohilum turcicum]
MAEASANISNEPTCQASESPANPEQPEEANQPEKHGARSLDNEEAALPGKQKIDKLPLPPEFRSLLKYDTTSEFIFIDYYDLEAYVIISRNSHDCTLPATQSTTNNNNNNNNNNDNNDNNDDNNSSSTVKDETTTTEEKEDEPMIVVDLTVLDHQHGYGTHLDIFPYIFVYLHSEHVRFSLKAARNDDMLLCVDFMNSVVMPN